MPMRLFPSIDPPQPAIGRSRRRIRISFSAKSRGEFGIGLKRHSDLVDEDSPALGRCQEESATGKNRPDRSRRPAPAPMNLKTNRTSPLRLGIFLFLLLFSFPLAAQPPARASGTNSPRWASARVVFDVSSLEHIFLRPEDIFANAERFWKEDGAYRLAKLWHERNNIPIPLDEWCENLKRIISTPASERSSHPVFALGKALAGSHAEFMKQALPHVCSNLPNTDVKLDTTVYFTAFTSARSFMTNDNIVINIMAPYWKGDPQHLLNAILHEVFHIGYGRNPTSQTLARQNDDRFCSLLRPLQNEGMATYVAFKAVAMYPAAAEKDYQLLANPADVIDLRNKLNGFFERATSLPADELQKRSWDIGVMQRAYYIIGADMARTIEGKAGRRALIDTITKGPRSFVTTYNALVPAADRIVELR